MTVDDVLERLQHNESVQADVQNDSLIGKYAQQAKTYKEETGNIRSEARYAEIKGRLVGRGKEIPKKEETGRWLAEVISLESHVMKSESKSRSVRVSDFIAEGLESAANSLPPSEKGKAQHLRECASIIRELENSRIITISEQG